MIDVLLSRLKPDLSLIISRLWGTRRRALLLVAVTIAFQAEAGELQKPPLSLERILQAKDLVVLADVKHGVRDRVSFFSSTDLFQAMVRSGVRHVAIEMPRVLGRQAMGIETSEDVDAFAQDVVRSDAWHFVDPEHPDQESAEVQYRVAFALGRQVLLAKQLGINPIFYDFNNPLGGFTTYNDPVYRCLAELENVTWMKYGLDGKVTKSQRNAAIMRERFSHDDELAAYVEQEVNARGGGKLVVISGYAHAVMPGGIADRLEHRLNREAAIVAIFKDHDEDRGFHNFLWQQSRLLSIDLSRSPDYYFTIGTGALRSEDAPGRYAALDGSRDRESPAICHQLAHSNE